MNDPFWFSLGMHPETEQVLGLERAGRKMFHCAAAKASMLNFGQQAGKKEVVQARRAFIVMRGADKPRIRQKSEDAESLMLRSMRPSCSNDCTVLPNPGVFMFARSGSAGRALAVKIPADLTG